MYVRGILNAYPCVVPNMSIAETGGILPSLSLPGELRLPTRFRNCGQITGHLSGEWNVEFGRVANMCT